MGRKMKRGGGGGGGVEVKIEVEIEVRYKRASGTQETNRCQRTSMIITQNYTREPCT